MRRRALTGLPKHGWVFAVTYRPRVVEPPRHWGRFVLWISVLCVLLVVSALGAASRAWATNVTGTISTNTTWTLANSPYVMTGNVTVAAGVTLTIQPGVVVQGNASSRLLTVNGSLSAVGTAANPITFTSTTDSAPGQWIGIRFGTGSGTSTLKYAAVRFGGTGTLSSSGMVEVLGGAVTIEDSEIRASRVSGLSMTGNSAGGGPSLTVRRTMFASNGFVGTSKQGHGLRVLNARMVVEDSAFWLNAIDGVNLVLASGYAQSASEVSGSSMYGNFRYGLYTDMPAAVNGAAPDGNIAGKPGNTIYDNGTFGFALGEWWKQMVVTNAAASSAMDWRGTYWGPVSVLPCTLGSLRGHLSYGAPFPDPAFTIQIPRGPVEYQTSTQGVDYCANDNALVDAPAYGAPDLYFDPPPPVFGGLLIGQTRGCNLCDQENPEITVSHDQHAASPLAHAALPVNTASGSLIETAVDLQLGGPGIPFAWTRTYNSQDTSSGALGTSWSHAFGAKITVVNPTTGELEYTSGSGQLNRFTKISGGGTGTARYAGKGYDGAVRRLADNTYQLTTRDQRVFSFNTSGQLTQIKPRFLPATTLAYTSGKLSSITDSAGRTISITYSVANPTLIDRATLPDARYVEYGYTSGRLTSVKDARGKTWTITYDGNGRLTSIRDPLNHYELQDILYDAQGRVTSEENGAGDAITYVYTTSGGFDLTTVSIPGRGSWVYKHLKNMLISVIDPLNRTSSFSYDGMARKATSTDGRGYTTRYEYDAYGNLTKEVAPQPLGYTSSSTYNATNDLLTQTDGRGNTTTNAYATAADAAADYQVGQLKTVTDRESGLTTFKYWTTTSSPAPPATNIGSLKNVTNQRSKSTSYEYDASGNLTKSTSPLGLKTTFTYDSSGRITGRRDPRGNVPVPPSGYLTQWAYDNVDHVSTFTDARGNETTYSYYDNEKLWKQTRTDTGGTPRITTFEYDSDNRLWKSTDPRGGVETRLYWPDGQLKSVESAEARKTSYTYDNAGQLTSMIEPNGNAPGATASDWTWTYGYDDSGNRTSEAHPDAGTSSIAYDAVDRPFQWTDPLSHVTSVEYDANDNIVESTDGLSHSRLYSYDKLDRLKTETDGRGKTWTSTYFATGEPETLTTPLTFKTSYGIDDDGRTTLMVEARGNAAGGTPADYTWAYGYDENGNRTTITDPLGNAITYEYNALGDVTKITDQRGNEMTLSYDVLNRLQTLTPPAAGAIGTLYTEYTYDPAGNLATRTDPNAHTTNWTYDLDGLVTARTTPIGTWNTTYDANGSTKTLETPAGSSTGTVGDGTISYSYDRMSRLTSTDHSDTTPDVSRTYDLAGRPATMTDNAGTLTYTFDNADRLTNLARTSGGAGLNGSFMYVYDDAGNITSRTYPDTSASTQTFDDDGRLATIVTGGATTTLAYDEAGNLTSTTLPSGNGHVETNSYDRAGRLTTVENTKSPTVLSKHVWTLDAAGNPIKAKTTRGATDVYDVYEYDARNRLTGACYDLASTATNCSGATNALSYAYDKVSNRTQEIRAGSVGNTGTISYAYNNADQLTSTTKSGNTTNYTYDTNGNQASAGGRTFTYDLASRLATTTNGGVTTTYGYDGDDRRVSSTTGGGADLRYTWDTLADSGIPELALERDSSGNNVRRYLNGPTGALNQTNTSATFWYHHDPLGTITDLTDATGAAQWKYEYEPYGAARTTTNVSGSAPTNHLRFNGQHLDPDTTLYHLRARQYDANIGRFGALDPLENSTQAPFDNAYGYVHGRPLYLIDPLGLLGVPPSLNRLADFSGAFGDHAKGVGAAIIDTGKALQPYTSPATAAREQIRTARDAYRTWREEGLREAFNQHYNPGLPFLINWHLCFTAETSYDRGYACTSAFRDTALLAAVGLGACRPAISFGKSGRIPRLANERGSLGGGRLDALTAAAEHPAPGGQTAAGRALQKHGDRSGSIYPRVNSPAERSRIAQELVEDYLTDPMVRERIRRDGVRIFELPDGRGVSFNPDGSFRGLLEPRS